MNAEQFAVPKFEYRNPCGDLDPHPLTKRMPVPDLESAEWEAFIDGLSAAGPDGIPPLVITDEGLVMDGCRRLLAARRLQWDRVPCVIRPEWEAPLIFIESLCGQRSYTKAAKVYLSLGLLKEYSEAARQRRENWLKSGDRPPQIAHNSPLPHSVGNGTACAALAGVLGTSEELVRLAEQLRKRIFAPKVVDHKFDRGDGTETTLVELVEKALFHPERPMGIGKLLQITGQFIDQHGNPVPIPTPRQYTALHYLQSSFLGLINILHSKRQVLPEAEHEKLMGYWKEVIKRAPDEAVEEQVEIWTLEVKRRQKAAQRHGDTEEEAA